MRDAPTIDWLMDDMPKGDALTAELDAQMEREIFNAWAAFLDTEQGRLIAWSILDLCHVFGTTYTGNAAQAFLEGERSVGLKILKGYILPLGNHLLGQMMDEASERHDRLSLVAEAAMAGDTDD